MHGVYCTQACIYDEKVGNMTLLLTELIVHLGAKNKTIE